MAADRPSYQRIDFLQFLVPICFLFLVIFFFPARYMFEFSWDEGINLMKAALAGQGYDLYAQVWSDQPPLFTWLLVGVFRIFGQTVAVGRGLTLAFSLLLIWTAYRIVDVIWGRVSALAAAVLVVCLPLYLVLSNSAMIGLPSIALALLSLFGVLQWHQRRSYLWIVLSAVAMAASVMTKMMTGFLAVNLVLGLLLGEWPRYKKGRNLLALIMPAFAWGFIFSLLVFAGVFFLVGWDNISQLFNPHLKAAAATPFDSREFTLFWVMRGSWWLLLVALVGAGFAYRQKRYLSLYLLAWLVSAVGLFFNHTPVWYHHLLIITIPAAMLAADMFRDFFARLLRFIREHVRWGAETLARTAAFLAILFMYFSFRPPETFTRLGLPPADVQKGYGLSPNALKVFNRMEKNAPETKWVVTDLPMFAFQAGLLVPPEISVFSEKRFISEADSEQLLLETIQKYRPEIIMFGRRDYPRVEADIASAYRQILVDDIFRMYLRLGE